MNIPNSNSASYTTTAAQGSDNGSTYNVIVTNGVGSNTSASATLNVTGCSQSINFNSLPSVTYGVAPITLSATASSGLPVSYAVTSGPASVTGSTLTITGAGAVTVTASQAGSPPVYTPATPVPQTFTVNSATLTVTPNNLSRPYGQPNPTLTYTMAGFLNGDTQATATLGAPGISTTATSLSPAGTYPITATIGTLSSANYMFHFVPGTLTVQGGVAQTISFGPLSNLTYGAAPIVLAATASSGLPVTYTIGGPASLSGSALSITGVGTVVVTANQAGNATYAAATPIQQSFTVSPAALAVTGNNLARPFGQANPPLTYGFTGFVNGDSQATATTGAPILSTTATSTSNVGAYPIAAAQGSLTAPNYTLTFANGTLTVNVATQAINFAPLGNLSYGAAPIALTATATSGLPVSYTVTGPASLSGSTLTITGVGSVTVTANQAGNGNYAAATPVPQSFTVGAAALTVTANNLGMSFGGTVPALTYAISGFVNGETQATATTGVPTLTTTATPTSIAGTYPIIISQGTLAATNYTFAFVNGTLTVGQSTQTINFAPLPNVIYGVAPIALTATASSGLAVSFAVTGPATVSGSTLTITGAGPVVVTANQAGNGSIAAATPVQQSFTVNPAALTVTANNLSRPFGQPNPTLTYTMSGFVNGESQGTATTGSPAISTTATSASTAGTYPITILQGTLAAANYTFTFVNGTLTVQGGVAQTISFGPLPNVTYGVLPINLSGTASSGLSVTYTASGPASVNGSTLTITGAGLVAVTANQTGNVNYAAATPVQQSFTVNPAALTVTASNLSMQAGSAVPTLTYAIDGFVNGDTQAAATTGGPTLATTAASTSPAGTYPITIAQGSLAATNYTLSFVSGTMTVTGGTSQTITFGPLSGVTYGAAPIALTATATSGLPVTYTVTGPGSVSGATLTITGAGPVTVTANQAGNGTFAAATPVPQAFTVSPALLTVTAANATRAFGQPNPTFSYSIAGFVNGETQAGATGGTPSLTTTATASSPVATYPITAAQGTLTATNYTFAFVNGTLTVSSATQTISFGPLSPVTYGAAPIALTATATSGLPVSFTVNGPASLSGSTLTITGVGLVTVTANQPGNGNYSAAAPVPQGFTVGTATLTVTANNLSMTFGAAVPTLTYAISGFVNSETQATVTTGAPSLATAATSTSNAGTYSITAAQGTLAAPNYTFTFVNGTLTVGQATQTITFGPLSGVTYGVAPIALTATASSGLPVSYTVSGPASVSGSTLTITGAGNVTVTANQAGNGNYSAATAVPQGFTVNKATLTVTAVNLSISFGQLLPSLTYTMTGFVTGDTQASATTGVPVLSTTAILNSPVGTYPITIVQGSLASTNYSFTFVNGTLAITGGVSQTITFGPLSGVTYGVAPIALTATATSGLPVSYTVSGPASISGSTLTITGAGPVGVTANQAGNLAFAAATPVLQSFTVAQAGLTVTASNETMAAGSAVPTLAYTMTGFVNGDSQAAATSGTPTVTTTATSLSPAGTYPITISQGSLNATNYAFTTFVNGTMTVTSSAAKLAFAQQPTATSAGATITPAVTVTIQDGNGNTVTTATNAVTIAIETNPSSGSLGGTLTVNALAGVATFSDLNINAAGNGYTLAANATGLAGATSNSFNVAASNAITINWSSVNQTMDGFGAASAGNVNTLPQALMNTLYSPTLGIGLDFIRLKIYPDQPDCEADEAGPGSCVTVASGPTLSVWDLANAQAAVALGARVIATEWSPPAFMKSNNSYQGGGSMIASPANYATLANIQTSFVSFLVAKGIPISNIYAISVQNEPDISQTYPSCLWTAQEFHDYVPILRSALNAAGYSGTVIMIAEPSTWTNAYATTAMNDATVAADVGILASHAYNSVASQLSYSNLTTQHQWETEVSDFAPFDPSITSALTYATQIHQWLTVAHASAWNYWLLSNDQARVDNEGLTDSTDTIAGVAKRAYAIGNWAKFVRPGWSNVGVSNSSALLVSAFQSADTTSGAIVIVNNTGADVTNETFSVGTQRGSTVVPWITSSTQSLAAQGGVAVNSGTVTYTIPANSIVTLVVGP